MKFIDIDIGIRVTDLTILHITSRFASNNCQQI